MSGKGSSELGMMSHYFDFNSKSLKDLETV